MPTPSGFQEYPDSAPSGFQSGFESGFGGFVPRDVPYAAAAAAASTAEGVKQPEKVTRGYANYKKIEEVEFMESHTPLPIDMAQHQRLSQMMAMPGFTKHPRLNFSNPSTVDKVMKALRKNNLDGKQLAIIGDICMRVIEARQESGGIPEDQISSIAEAVSHSFDYLQYGTEYPDIDNIKRYISKMSRQ